MNIEEFTLPNGLKIILESIENAQSVTVCAAVGAGPRHETKETVGLAHFLEHMLLEGTRELPNSKKVAEYIENVGGKYGAFTEKDHVIYYAKMLPEQIGRGINFIHQLLFQPLLSPKDIEKEKNIVFEEIKRAKDNPEVEVWNIFDEWIWGRNQTLGRPTLGYPATIDRVTREKLLEYIGNLYESSNIAISIVGKIDSRQVKKIVQKIFKEGNKSKVPEVEIVNIIRHKKRLKTIPYKAKQAQLILGFPNVVGYNHPDRYPLAVTATLLGGASSARLFHKIVYELGIAYSMGVYSLIWHEAGTFSIYGGFSSENIGKAVSSMLDELTKIKKIRLTEDELNEAKEKTKANIFFYTETTDSLATAYASQQMTENHITTLDKMAQKIDKVKVEDIYRVSNTHFTKEAARLLIRGPINKKLVAHIEQLLNNFQ